MATSSYPQANLSIFHSSLLKEFFKISIINIYNESKLFILTILYETKIRYFKSRAAGEFQMGVTHLLPPH